MAWRIRGMVHDENRATLRVKVDMDAVACHRQKVAQTLSRFKISFAE